MGKHRAGKSAAVESLETRRLMSSGSGVLELAGTAATGRLVLAGSTVQNPGITQIAKGTFITTGTVTLLDTIHTAADEPITVNDVIMDVTSKGTLNVQGSIGNDNITLVANKKSYAVSVLGKMTYFSKNGIKRISIEGGAGKDNLSITGNPDVPVSLLGGAGNDVLKGGVGGETLIGGDGNDQLDAAGTQFAVYNSTVISGSVQPVTGWIRGGSVGGQLIYGESLNDEGSLLLGGNGDDTITASGGPDTISGGRGNDAITRQVANNTQIPIDENPSPGDVVDSIELTQFIVPSATQTVVSNGTVHLSDGTFVYDRAFTPIKG